jgi:hypothetical protein
MQDELDEIALKVLLTEGLEVPTSLVGAARGTQDSPPARQLPSWVRAAIVLGAIVIAWLIYILLR